MKKTLLALTFSLLASTAFAGTGSKTEQALIAEQINPKNSRIINYTLRSMNKPRLIKRVVVEEPEPYTLSTVKNAETYGLKTITFEPKTHVVYEEPKRYIIVNIPAFMTYAIEDGKVIISSKTIVGKGTSQSTKTPIMKTNVNNIAWNPYWAPPFKYNKHETLRGWQKDSGYMREHSLSVVRNSDHYILPESELTDEVFLSNDYTIAQTPGDNNMLGKALFFLDNKYDVYMHDTNDHKLFDSSKRNFSLGCIRIQEWLDISSWILDMPASQIQAEIATGEMIFHPLQEDIPVYVVYWPVDVVDGKVVYYNDFYNWVN